MVDLTVERASRRIVARVLGCHDATAQRLRAALHRYPPLPPHADQWEAYAKLLPTHRPRPRPRPKGSGNSSIVEAVNRSLCQRCGVLVQKSCSFSKSPDRHTARIKNIIDNYALTLN